MPRLYPDAPDLAVSPDGVWVADLTGGRLRLYDLGRSGVATDAAGSRLQPIGESERPAGPGRVGFLSEDRLLHLWQVPPSEGAQGSDEQEGYVAAELLTVPTLSEAGRGLRVPGCSRIVGVGPAGAVVAPSGPGADIIAPRGNELTLHRTFIRGEVLSAIAAPDRRFLMEQRSGFELWDPQSRKALARLLLNTRQAPAHLGFALSGRLLWAVTGTIPVHVEIFRASDGRRLFELDQPGRALQADSGPGRLVVAVEERGSVILLDLDLGARALRRIALPPGVSRPRSFLVSPDANNPEVLLLLEEEQAPLLRLPLARSSAQPQSATTDDRERPARAPAGRGVGRSAPGESTTRGLRQSRPETRLIRRAPPAAPPPTELESEEEAAPLLSRPAAVAARNPFLLEEPEPDPDALTDADGVSGESAPVLSLGFDASPERPAAGLRAKDRKLEMLGRVFDPRKSPAAWQWELARWAQTLFAGSGAALLPMPPEGGPLATLSKRLHLSPVAHKVLGLAYAAQALLGCRPHGLRPIELAQLLGPLHEEPAVLAELLPPAPLRTLELLVARRDGRLKLRPEVVAYLLGSPCPELTPSAAGGREPLMPGLYLLPGVCPAKPQPLIAQSVLRVDGLREPRPLDALARALHRAQIYDAAVLIDGLAGLSFPAFSSDGSLPQLRAMLLSSKVPTLLCAMPEAPAAMGLMARALPPLAAAGDRSAPLLPSAPLPLGTSWRAPTLPAQSAALDGQNPKGRLEHLTPGDRRAAVVVSASATPDAYASAAYLAARDGAVLVLDAELTTVRALVLGMLLRQLPVCIAAVPPAGPGTPWPPALQPFALPLSARP